MSSKPIARELVISLIIVAACELVFFLLIDEPFSFLIYFNTVFEVFAAPIHPGWKLTYPPIIFALLLICLGFTTRINRKAVRVALFTAINLAWAFLGFLTIGIYYR